MAVNGGHVGTKKGPNWGHVRFGFAKASAPYRGQNRENREKRVSGSKNSHFPVSQKEMGALSQKTPIFLVEPCREMGIFWLKAPISGTLGNGSFLTPKPSFPDFRDFDPCRGRTLSKVWVPFSCLNFSTRSIFSTAGSFGRVCVFDVLQGHP